MKFLAGMSMCPFTLSCRVGAVAGSAYVIYKAVQLRQRLSTYSARRKEAADAKKAVEEDLDETNEEETEKSIEELLSDLRAGRITSLQTVRAFLAKALRVSQDTNCVTEPVLHAQDAARALDEARSSGSKLGLLHGLPVSVKECFDIRGMCSTIGFAKWCKPAEKDSVMVAALRAQGAVPFVKTNVPQSMISFECSNPIFGVTCHPQDHSRGPGGSSGGEGALIASGGSVLGIGSDIGGSLRMPAAFCGLCALKPTEGRLSNEGVATVLAGQSGIAKASGVLAKEVVGCRLLMQALCCEEVYKLDRRIVPMPFNNEVATSKQRLRIGYYDSDGFFPCTPAYQRAVHEAKAALEATGHKLVPFNPPQVMSAVSLYYSLATADDGRTMKAVMHNETVDPAIAYGYNLLCLPWPLRRVLAGILFVLWPRMYTMLGNIKLRSVQELWKLQKQRQDYRALWCAEWEREKLDGLICPSHAMGPLPLGMCARLTASCSYTFLFNLLDFPAGVVPVTKVSDADDEALSTYPRDDLWTRNVASFAKGMVGLPVAVQCVTLPWQDEQCLNLMQEVESSVKMYHSGTH